MREIRETYKKSEKQIGGRHFALVVERYRFLAKDMPIGKKGEGSSESGRSRALVDVRERSS
jgi:hypothetical protein